MPGRSQDLVGTTFDKIFPADGDPIANMYLNSEAKCSLLLGIDVEDSRLDDDENPCFLWSRSNIRVRGALGRMKCHRIIYLRCIGRLERTQRIEQACPTGALCIQPRHLRIKGLVVHPARLKEQKKRSYFKGRAKILKRREEMYEDDFLFDTTEGEDDALSESETDFQKKKLETGHLTNSSVPTRPALLRPFPSTSTRPN